MAHYEFEYNVTTSIVKPPLKKSQETYGTHKFIWETLGPISGNITYSGPIGKHCGIHWETYRFQDPSIFQDTLGYIWET